MKPTTPCKAMWRLGYQHGSYIPTSWYNSFKKGIEEWPELYALCVGVTITTSGLFYGAFRQEAHKDYTARYKYGYHIVRPNDPRLQMYPVRYVTDKHYLPPNHPRDTKDLDLIHLGPSPIHAFDPNMHEHKKFGPGDHRPSADELNSTKSSLKSISGR